MEAQTLVWKECPDANCGKVVFIVDGVISDHVKPRHKRRWPKMGEACPRGGTTFHAEPTPLLGEI